MPNKTFFSKEYDKDTFISFYLVLSDADTCIFIEF